MGLRRVEDIKCAVSACVAVYARANDLCVRERASVCVNADDLRGSGGTVCMTQIAGFTPATRLKMVTREASAGLRTSYVTLSLPAPASTNPPLCVSLLCFVIL